jgi:pyridoxal phosphate enzyme (YggS family)
MTRPERLAAIRDRISQAAGRAGRSSDEVTLIAVSKTFPEEAILEVASFGQVAFGENKVQELVRKTDALGKGTPDQPLEWHHIGHLQRNKVKDVIGRVALFHALDSVRLGQAMQNRLEGQNTTLDCLVQVNVSGEESKFGISPGALDTVMDELSVFERVRVRGFMTLASPAANPEDVRHELALLRTLAQSVSDRIVDRMPLLSMGMSSDYEVAIEEGATHVRIGSAIFGTR